MDVGFGIFGGLVHDHNRQLGNVDPPGGDIGGDQEAQAAVVQTRHHFFARILGQIRGEFIGVIAKTLQDDGHIVHLGAGVAENNRLGRIIHLDDADQGAVFIHRRHNVERVLGFGDIHLISAQADEFRLVKEFIGQMEDERRKGGREHVGIEFLGEVLLDLFHVRIKAHREHAIGFIENQNFKAVEIEGAFEQMIENTPRSADHQMSPFAEGLNLAAIADAAVDSG